MVLVVVVFVVVGQTVDGLERIGLRGVGNGGRRRVIGAAAKQRMGSSSTVDYRAGAMVS
jgi:hypothetical protein